MHLLRARFANDIVAEFLPPKKSSRRVIIVCDGMPTVPGKKRLMEFFSKKGYWCVNPRYRGTWESGGTFLDHSPVDDMKDVIDGLYTPVKSLWDGIEYDIDPESIVIIGCSFGGPAALLLSKDPRVHAVVGVAAVTDWTRESGDEPLDWLYDISRQAFGEGYRMDKARWDKLATGSFYNPASSLELIDSAKVLLLHAKNDSVVPYDTAADFAQKTGTRLLSLPQGEHLSSSILMRWRVWRQVKKHIHR